MIKEIVHQQNLMSLLHCDGLTQIGEDPYNLAYMLVEPVFFRESALYQEREETPDLIMGYFNGDHSIVELKYSWSRKPKAIHQIQQGIDFLVDMYDVSPDKITGKMVVRQPEGFIYKTTHKNGKRCH
jgi:hypothetical protein